MSKKRETPTVEPEPRMGPPPVHAEDQQNIKTLLFSQVERPKNLHEVRVVNVFDDRYRINVWVRLEEDGVEKRKIASSYFARYDGERLELKA